jgi:glycosyltransferase involved in cell wall biosynthesis
MKLLFVSHRRDVSGGEICTQRILERLQGHKVRVILPEGAFSRRLADAGIDFQIEDALTSMTRAEDPYAFLHLAACAPALVTRLSRKMREFGADLVVSNGLGPLPYAGPAARLAGTPNICLHYHPVIQPGSSNAKLVFLLSKFCDGFIAVSEAMNRGLQAAGVRPDRIKTIYNGLDLDDFKPTAGRSNLLRTRLGLAPEVKLIGLVATISENKGHHVVIEAACRLRDEFKVEIAWRVVFIGDVFENSALGAAYKSRLQEQIARAQLQDHIIFGGKHANMREVYQDLDMVLNASIEPEPLGTTIYEAMAMGRLAIASDLGGSPEIIRDGETGFLVSAGDSRALAEVLAKILRDEIDLAPILLAARRRIEEAFDLRDTVRRYVEFFESHAKKK